MFKLAVNPTFRAKVPIPVPGANPVPIEFEFRHFPKSEVDALVEKIKGVENDVEVVMMVACGWHGVDQSFNAESVALLLDNWQGAGMAIATTFWTELRGARIKN